MQGKKVIIKLQTQEEAPGFCEGTEQRRDHHSASAQGGSTQSLALRWE